MTSHQSRTLKIAFWASVLFNIALLSTEAFDNPREKPPTVVRVVSKLFIAPAAINEFIFHPRGHTPSTFIVSGIELVLCSVAFDTLVALGITFLARQCSSYWRASRSHGDTAKAPKKV